MNSKDWPEGPPEKSTCLFLHTHEDCSSPACWVPGGVPGTGGTLYRLGRVEFGWPSVGGRPARFQAFDSPRVPTRDE